ncbi:MAG: BadF/BadG/BcrA/BcrD ATPase family protein [Candidatus Neomarinimicrobiota bacterium]
MKTYLGIDLGSTTSKAVFLDDQGSIIGRGITNTRANYEVAADIARMEAEFNSRFTLLQRRLSSSRDGAIDWPALFSLLEGRFQFIQFQERFRRLMETMRDNAPAANGDSQLLPNLDRAGQAVQERIRGDYLAGKVATGSQFFRDLFGGAYMHTIEDLDQALQDRLMTLYDRSITPVENQLIKFDFAQLLFQSIDLLPEGPVDHRALLEPELDRVAGLSLEPTDYIGTGYGRQLLPFEAKHIKSEILCHALGAHAYFPQTRTVLDIGGQDTKAIQVDGHGLVTSFQMNDRCAAGCGRYLGYIADEMNISVNELGPLAVDAEYEANICSTCTVFAGAELREYLNLGEKKENILAGLHLAIVQRAFALLARSGGVRDEFTFTGGVARNEAVVKYVSQLVSQNYGDLQINIHPDSIYMGAVGAALFSSRRKDN